MSSTESSVSLQEEETKPFESLQSTVYSEVASLISANEARPHYLVELVRELSGTL